MSQKKIHWINTKTIWQWDGEKYVEIHNEGYEYSGPMALAHNQADTNQVSYRLYQSDNSTAVAAQNTTGTCDVDTAYVCRIMIENTGDIAETTQTYNLQYQNTTQATGWQNVSGSSSHVRTADASGLTDGTAVTSATMTGQAASTFTNGQQIEDAVGPSLALGSNNYTEYWYAFQILGADVANSDAIQLRVVGSSLGVLDGYSNTPSITARELTPTTVTLTGDSLTITDGTLTVSQTSATEVALIADSLAITDGSLTVQADVDTNVSLTPEALAITDVSLTVDALFNTVVSLTGDALTLSDGSLVVVALVNTVVALTGDSLAITDGTLTVQTSTNTVVSLTPDSLTITDGTLQTSADKNLNLISDSLTITDGSLTVQARVNLSINMLVEALTITDATMNVDATINYAVDMLADALTITDTRLPVTTLNFSIIYSNTGRLSRTRDISRIVDTKSTGRLLPRNNNQRSSNGRNITN